MTYQQNAKAAAALALLLVACQQRQQPQVIMGPIVDTKGYWYRVKPKAPLRWMPGPTTGTPTVGIPPTVQVVPTDLGPPPLSPEERKKQIRKKFEDVNTSIYNLRQGLKPEGANLPSKDQGKFLPKDENSGGRVDKPTDQEVPPPPIPLPAENH